MGWGQVLCGQTLRVGQALAYRILRGLSLRICSWLPSTVLRIDRLSLVCVQRVGEGLAECSTQSRLSDIVLSDATRSSRCRSESVVLTVLEAKTFAESEKTTGASIGTEQGGSP